MEKDKVSEEYVYLNHVMWLSVLHFIGRKILDAENI